MKLKGVGFFFELRHGDKAGPSLRGAARGRGEKDERKLISYLKKGTIFIVCLGFARDVLDEAAGFTAPPHIFTDGVWAWPGDLRYYVKKYHVELPDEFLAHIRSRRYSPPREKDLDLAALEL